MTRLAMAGTALLGLLFGPGCGTATEVDREPAAADTTTATVEPAPTEAAPANAPETAADAAFRLDAHRTLGDPVRIGALTVWPVLTDAPEDTGPMAAIADAQRRHEADIRERGADAAGLSLAQVVRERRALRGRGDGNAARLGATVNELVVDNGGRAPLFVPAGTLFRGGQQDRVLAEDLVVAADTAAIARVYCVEPGRWTSIRMGAATAGRFQAVACVAVSEVRAAGQYERSQEGVWNEVAVVHRGQAQAQASSASAAATPPATRDAEESSTLLASVEGAPAEVHRERDDAVSAVLRHFETPVPSGVQPVGFAYAIGSRPVAVRAFANSALFRAQLSGYARAMAMEAQSAPRDARDAASAARAEDVVALVRAIESSEKRTVENRGASRIAYVTAAEGWSSSCVVTRDGREVTVAQDWTAR